MSITEQALRQAVNGGYRTLKDIGADFGVTGERIRQLYNRYSIERGERSLSRGHRPWDEYSRGYRYELAPRSRWPREGMAALKRTMGLCQRWGCFSERTPNRASCPRCLRIIRANAKRYQADHRQRGLCLNCTTPAASGHRLCQRHLDGMRVANRSRRAAA